MTARLKGIVVAATVACLAASGLHFGSPDRATAAARRPKQIYRVRVTVATSSSSQAVTLLSPAVFIVGRSTPRTAATSASFGGFGSGPLRVQGPAGRWHKATFVVALTPSGATSLRFGSSKARGGTTTIKVENLNRATSSKRIAKVRHTRRHGSFRTFSIPVRRVSARGPAPASAPLEPEVLAFYYPWYRLSHWVGGSTARYNRNDNPYDSGHDDAIARHLRQATDYGIDAFVSSWWGRGSFTDDNLKKLFAALPVGFEVGIYFETRSDAFQSRRAIINQLDYALEEYGSRPQYLDFKGKPVVYFYSSAYVLRGESGPLNPDYRNVWRGIFKHLRKRGHRFKAVGMGVNPGDFSVFDGLHLYSTRTTWFLNYQMTLISRAYASVHGRGRRLWTVAVAPGYDDRHLPERTRTTYVPRNNGAHYRSQWSAAISNFADRAVILSFNEWFETTNIEPNRRWGNKYLRITQDKARAYKRPRSSVGSR